MNVISCPKCGAQVHDSFKFCPKCKQALVPDAEGKGQKKRSVAIGIVLLMLGLVSVFLCLITMSNKGSGTFIAATAVIALVMFVASFFAIKGI